MISNTVYDKFLQRLLSILSFNPIHDGPCWLISNGKKGGGGGAKSFPLFQICYTYLTMMKLGTALLYLKKIQKYINGMPHRLISADINSFSPEISNNCILITF